MPRSETEMTILNTTPFDARRLTYLEAVAAQAGPHAAGPDAVAQLIPREVFHLLPRLALGRGPNGASSAELLGPPLAVIAARRDCADFALAGVLRLLYRFPDSPLLSMNDYAGMREAVVGFSYWYDQPGIRGMCFHTENHQILFHSCEVLAGQMFPDTVFPNSGRNGAWHAREGAERVRRWIDHRLRFGFSEWLSSYIEEDLLALLNLYDFASDADLRRRAGMLVDILLFEMAIHSYKGVLGTTHGRTYAEFLKGAREDPNTGINWLFFGTGVFNGRSGIALSALATSDYRCPSLIEAIALDQLAETVSRERHGLNVADASQYGLDPTRREDAMFFWACQTARHPLARATALEVAEIAQDPWLLDFINGADTLLAETKALVESGGATFDGDAVNTALSEANLYTFRTPDYMLSCAQDFRPGRPGYQQHIWQATLGIDAVVFTNHPGNESESSAHGDRPNFWAGNRFLPRAAQEKNVLVCLHHVPSDDPLPFSHAYFPRDAFDETLQRGPWTFGRSGDGYLALFSQHPAAWTSGDSAELRAESPDNIWICEMGTRVQHGDFARFVAAIEAAPVTCGGLSVRYESPTLGPVSFGWTGPLSVSGRDLPLSGYPRFDNPYCHSEIGERTYTVERDGTRLIWNAASLSPEKL
ncbi:MAG: hypothetical protein V4671_06285 [Armatimonadota bacterium]